MHMRVCPCARAPTGIPHAHTRRPTMSVTSLPASRATPRPTPPLHGPARQVGELAGGFYAALDRLQAAAEARAAPAARAEYAAAVAALDAVLAALRLPAVRDADPARIRTG